MKTERFEMPVTTSVPAPKEVVVVVDADGEVKSAFAWEDEKSMHFWDLEPAECFLRYRLVEDVPAVGYDVQRGAREAREPQRPEGEPV